MEYGAGRRGCGADSKEGVSPGPTGDHEGGPTDEGAGSRGVARCWTTKGNLWGNFAQHDQIVAQELRTLTLALRWAARSSRNWNKKLLTFTDPLSAAGAVRKGSEWSLRNVWAPSESNHADGPSRGESVAGSILYSENYAGVRERDRSGGGVRSF